MIFDLPRIKADIDAAPVEPPYPLDLAIAVLADLFREAQLAPPPDDGWAPLLARGSHAANRPGQIAALARLVAISALRPASLAALAARPPRGRRGDVRGLPRQHRAGDRRAHRRELVPPRGGRPSLDRGPRRDHRQRGTRCVAAPPRATRLPPDPRRVREGRALASR